MSLETDATVSAALDAISEGRHSWAVFSYVPEARNLLTCVGAGSGGVGEVAKLLRDDAVMFCYVRIDDGKTILVCFVGEGAKSVFKAKASIHRRNLAERFKEPTAQVNIAHIQQLTDEFVLETLGSPASMLAPNASISSPTDTISSGRSETSAASSSQSVRETADAGASAKSHVSVDSKSNGGAVGGLQSAGNTLVANGSAESHVKSESKSSSSSLSASSYSSSSSSSASSTSTSSFKNDGSQSVRTVEEASKTSIATSYHATVPAADAKADKKGSTESQAQHAKSMTGSASEPGLPTKASLQATTRFGDESKDADRKSSERSKPAESNSQKVEREQQANSKPNESLEIKTVQHSHSEGTVNGAASLGRIDTMRGSRKAATPTTPLPPKIVDGVDLNALPAAATPEELQSIVKDFELPPHLRPPAPTSRVDYVRETEVMLPRSPTGSFSKRNSSASADFAGNGNGISRTASLSKGTSTSSSGVATPRGMSNHSNNHSSILGQIHDEELEASLASLSQEDIDQLLQENGEGQKRRANAFGLNVSTSVSMNGSASVSVSASLAGSPATSLTASPAMGRFFAPRSPPPRSAEVEAEVSRLTELLEKVAEGNSDITELNLNNNPYFTEDHLELLAKGLKDSDSLKVVELANINLGSAGVELLAESLRHNHGLLVLNLESNSISGKGIEQLAAALEINTGLQELRISNQRQPIGVKAETCFAKAVQMNHSLLKLGLSFSHKAARDMAEGAIFRNKDEARKRRNQN